MNNDKDLMIWKLDKDLSRARLALGRIYHIVSKVYCPEAKHAMSSIHRDNVDKIVETLQEFFNEDYERNSNRRKDSFRRSSKEQS